MRLPFNKLILYIIFFVVNISFAPINKLTSQSYYVSGPLALREVSLDDCNCSIQTIGPNAGYEGLSFSPEGALYALTDWTIYEIDLSTGNYFPVFSTSTPLPNMFGFISVGNGIFYSKPWDVANSDLIYRWNINSGTVVPIGGTGYIGSAEMCISGGNIYSSANYVVNGMYSIIKIDTLFPSNSELIISYPWADHLNGMTASQFCKTLLGTHSQTNELAYLSLIDGAITPVCDLGAIYGQLVATMLEHAPEPNCILYLDLDCDDSSGASDADFNAPEYDCLSDGVRIADNDIKMLYDAIISSMTINVTGNVPNAPHEIVTFQFSVPNINVTGNGTDMITLTNAGGAKSTDFKAALQQIRYKNNADYPSAGPRTVEVQFTTESGLSSNIATAFIEVNELPLIPLDLGPDQMICEGEIATFNAGGSNVNYQWSSGQVTQSISVNAEGEYIVTVSNGIDCPNRDTALLEVVPIYHISLQGDYETCDNEVANLIISTDAPFPITVDISTNTGATFTFSNVTGNFGFIDLISDNTVYFITNVEPSQPSCVEIIDPDQEVDVHTTYIHSAEVNICDGDSVWLGFFWETEPGVYENTLNTFYGCDSVVTTTINVFPAIHLSAQGTTCDSAAAGVHITYLNNPNGCDTVLTTTVSLLPSDTTLVTISDCNASDTGVFIQVLTNLSGCDSSIITNITYTPSPFTYFPALTCDPSQIGVFQQLYLDLSGCDSVVVTTVSMAPSDTTLLSDTSCDPASIGVFESLHSNQLGCDSLVIATVSAGIPDSTYLFTTTCDSSGLGVFEEVFTTLSGCDSTVFTTVTYSASDSTFFNVTSCDPDDVGVFIENHINRFGCDSIVTIDVALAISHDINLSSSSCNPADTGVFVIALMNQFGCDSIVTTAVGLLPADETLLFSTTCMSSQAGMLITTHLNQHGCDSIVTHTVSLVPADTTTFSFKTCDPASVGSIENTFPNQDGCDSLVIEETTLYPLPELNLEVTSDFNGYHISCFGESDGSIIAEVNGIDPLTYLWSTGSKDQSVTGLAAGSYSVLVTDGNGCTKEAEVMLLEPEEFSISFMVSQPDCFDQNQGSVTVEQTGGIEPVRYSIDDVNYQASSVFSELSGGTYTITALDANDCEVKEIIWINVPLMVQVDLGDDQILYPGDTAIINAIVNVPFDSLANVTWSGLSNAVCPNCLSQPVAPIITTTYSVTVVSHDGCKDDDAMTLFVVSENDVYIPNVFSPNGDGINDLLVIYGGAGVAEISELVIFDRWGDVVYAASNFQPDEIAHAWDGKMRGHDLNPGVFAYKVIVMFVNGESDVRYGDVTLVR